MSIPPRLGPGVTFGPFQIVQALGRGGMATVWKAYEPSLDRYVALKVLPAEFLHEESFAARFQREARVVAKLEHPHIVPIFAFGIENDIPWMSMRLISRAVPGAESQDEAGSANLASFLAGGRILPRRRAVEILRAVAEALTYAHGQGVMHRDVKPQNILLDEAGRVYLADFGIARMVEGGAPLTRTGLVSGTPQYMAPEYALGTPLDHRVDIYALGIVAYEMFTGTTPFSADTPVAILFKQVQSPIPVPPAEFVPEPLLGPLLKSLAKEPADRWSSAVEFVAALERGLAALPAETAPDSRSRLSTAATMVAPFVTKPVPGPPRTTSWRSVGVGAALLVVAVLALWAWKGRERSVAAPGLAAPPQIAAAPTASAEPAAPPEPLVVAPPVLQRPRPRPPAEPVVAMAPPAAPAIAPPMPPPPEPAKPIDLGTPWRLGGRIPMNQSSGPASLEAIQFAVLPKGDLEAQLELRCAEGHDQTVSWKILIVGADGNQLAELGGEKGIDEGDEATVRKKYKVSANTLAAARGFRVRLSSVDD